ncbi:MAG: hypothetical protein HY744_32505, partial [Deltaproteobacteria bacterium]|nr:hypothetical protein [Deltaproteobacteria bacterium]
MLTPSSEDLAARLLRHGIDRARAHGDALPEPLAACWREIYGGWQERIGPGGPERQFASAMGTPAFVLLGWVAESVLPEPAGEPVLDAAEAMACWYLALRCQDDVVDEGAPAERVYLAQTLESRALGLMLRAAGQAEAMLAVWEEIVVDFAAAALEDVRKRAAPDSVWDERAIALQGRKFLPMAGPLAALLVRAGKADAWPRLRQTVERLSVGLQLTNDLAGASEDLAAGRHSPFLGALGLRPGLHAAADVEPAIRRGLRTGAWPEYLERTRAALRSALEPLAALPSPRLAEHVRGRIAALEEHGHKRALCALGQAEPLVLDLEVTRRCNLCCNACYVRAQEPA